MEYWIWLSTALGPGSPRVNDVAALFGSAREFYAHRANSFHSLDFLTTGDRQKLMSASLDDARRLLDKTMAKGYTVLTPEQEGYPNRLRNIYAMPAVLYVDGDLGKVDEYVAVAVVGARKCTDYGVAAAEMLGRDLARMGAVVITGMARGIDGAAHGAALKAGGSTIAVMGCGLDVTYPPEHGSLRRKIPEKGAVISEFPLGAKPEGFHFPIRNRIMSALSLGVVVVEGEAASGSLITANHALEQGKDVFAVPGSVFSPLSKGPMRLLRTGAIPISGAGDILEEYRYRYAAKINWEEPADVPEKQQPVSKLPAEETASARKKRPLPEDVDGLVAEIYKILSEVPMQLDEIAAQAQKNPAEVLTALSELEIMGFVSANAGKRFRVC